MPDLRSLLWIPKCTLSSAWATEHCLAWGETWGDRTDPSSLPPCPQLPNASGSAVPSAPISVTAVVSERCCALPPISHIPLLLAGQASPARERPAAPPGAGAWIGAGLAHPPPSWAWLCKVTTPQLTAESLLSDSPEGTDCHQPLLALQEEWAAFPLSNKTRSALQCTHRCHPSASLPSSPRSLPTQPLTLPSHTFYFCSAWHCVGKAKAVSSTFTGYPLPCTPWSRPLFFPPPFPNTCCHPTMKNRGYKSHLLSSYLLVM